MSRPLLRWVLPMGGSRRLGELAAELGGGTVQAVADGRVFIDGRRESAPEAVVPEGSVLEVHPARAHADGVEVLAEHHGLIFASKPPGVATEPDHAGVEASLVARVAALVGVPRAELHALSRLDVGVSGVVTLARDAAGRELVQKLRARGAFTRRYVALAARAPEPPAGAWTYSLARDAHARRGSQPSEERAAETRYALVASASPAYLPSRSATREEVRPALLALSPLTGRTHQLRLHAELAGLPLLGDPAHGGPGRLLLPSGSVRALERVGLHAAWVELEHRGARLRVTAPLPEELVTLWVELGGRAEDWANALEIALSPV